MAIGLLQWAACEIESGRVESEKKSIPSFGYRTLGAKTMGAREPLEERRPA
jgi:hypothetical protein